MVQSKPKNWRFSKNSISKLLSSFLYWCLERSGLGRGGVLTVFCLAVNYGVKLIVFQLCGMSSIVISYWEAFTDISEDNWPEEGVKEAAATTNNPVWCKIFIFHPDPEDCVHWMEQLSPRLMHLMIHFFMVARTTTI